MAGVLSLEALSDLDLAGRAFRSREGRARFPGFVQRAVVDGDSFVLEIASAERRGAEEQPWKPIPPFTYGGQRDVTTICENDEGGVSIGIMYIGSTEILPTGTAT